MLFYCLIILAFYVIWAFFKNYKNKNIALIIMGFSLFLLMGLRGYSVGTDTSAYYRNFYSYQNVSLIELIKDNSSFGESNFLYFLLCKIVAFISPNGFTLFLLAVSAFITFVLVKLIKRFSDDHFISVVIAFSLGFIFFFMTGVKQTLAIAAALLAIISLADGKTWKFLLWTAVATLFHNTAIIILLIWAVKKINFKKLYLIIVPVMVVVSSLYSSVIVRIFSSYLSDSKYGNYGSEVYESSNNLTGLLIQLVCFAFVLILMWNKKNDNKEFRYLLGIAAVGIFFQCLVSIIAEFFRISMYFSIVSIVLIPYSIKNTTLIKEKDKPLLKIVVCLVFFAYFLVSNSDNTSMIPYVPFWG